MSAEGEVSKWLRDNTDLSWTRTAGDGPQVKRDRLYTNRSEGYEIRDVILNFYEECNLEHKPENYEKTLAKILNYRTGEKVKTEDLMTYLIGTIKG